MQHNTKDICMEILSVKGFHTCGINEITWQSLVVCCSEWRVNILARPLSPSSRLAKWSVRKLALYKIPRWFSSCLCCSVCLLWFLSFPWRASLTIGRLCRLNESAYQGRHWKQPLERRTVLLLVIPLVLGRFQRFYWDSYFVEPLITYWMGMCHFWLSSVTHIIKISVA